MTLTEFDENVAVDNVIGGSHATIIPGNDYPLAVSKVDADDPQASLSGGVFEVRSGSEVLYDDLEVVEGRLLTRDGRVPTVTEPGTYQVVEVRAPAGYVKGEIDTFDITVVDGGGVAALEIANRKGEDPQPDPRVSVGDLVWFDEDGDGLQSPGEPGIPGVVLEIVGPDGEPARHVDGTPVEPTTTDADGGYTFDDLPVLAEGQSYTVRIVRDDPSTVTALEPYVPTTETDGERDRDSSTWEASSEGLTADGERDDTLDFGFVLKPAEPATYAIGDYVWIDENRDGLQGPDEQPLAGVAVTLFVVSEDGTRTRVATTTTDDAGRYLFDELAAGVYQVEFVLTDEQAELYGFTSPDADGHGRNSDADPLSGLTREIVLDDTNTSLTTDYDREVKASRGIDPTWDAGVILRDVEPTPGPTEPTPGPTEPTPGPTEPTPSGEPTPSASGTPGQSGDLSGTGAPVLGAIVVAALALLLGVGLVVRRTRTA